MKLHGGTEVRTRSRKHRLIAPLALAVLCVLGGTPPSSGQEFLRGDPNGDGGVDLGDPVCILFHLFSMPGSPCTSPTCKDSLDANDDGNLNIADPMYLLSFLFGSGASPPLPGILACGPDPTQDALDCVSFAECPTFSCPVIPAGSIGLHRAPDLALTADGGSVVVWETDREGNGLFQIRGSCYLADGTERVAPFTVNSVSAGQQLRPAIAVDPTDHFVVVWEDDSNLNQLYNVRGRGFNRDGTERFAQIDVNLESSGQQLDPDVAVNGAGDFVVVWEQDRNNDGRYQIDGRGFGSDGVERIPEFMVNTHSSGQKADPVIAMDGAGKFVVAWAEDGNLDGNFEILARGFNADGLERFPEFTVNSHKTGQQVRPAMAMDGTGRFVVVWEDDRDGDGQYQVHGRAFNADGTERIAEFTANIISAGQQVAPTVSMNAAGAFAVGWHGDRDLDNEYHVYWRRFTDTGVGDLEDTKVDCFEPAQHIDPALGLNGSGRVIIFWEETVVGQKTQVIGRTFPLSGG